MRGRFSDPRTSGPVSKIGKAAGFRLRRSARCWGFESPLAYTFTGFYQKEDSWMVLLSQIVRIEAGVRGSASNRVDALASELGNSQTKKFSGERRVYTPLDREDPETQPNAVVAVQSKAWKMLDEIGKIMTRLLDVEFTRDKANMTAKADIKLPGTASPLVSDVPVPYLLFLTKQLDSLASILARVPTLSPTEKWRYSSADGWYRGSTVEQNSTKKIATPLVLFEGNEHHQPQTQVIHVDKIVGKWQTTHFSGAMERDALEAIRERLEVLREAVKYAIEEANSQEVPDLTEVGVPLFAYLFQDSLNPRTEDTSVRE